LHNLFHGRCVDGEPTRATSSTSPSTSPRIPLEGCRYMGMTRTLARLRRGPPVARPGASFAAHNEANVPVSG
jgi:hypothetical protein